jgi:hypothetical protein
VISYRKRTRRAIQRNLCIASDNPWADHRIAGGRYVQTREAKHRVAATP